MTEKKNITQGKTDSPIDNGTDYDDSNSKAPTLFQVILSVMAAFIGIQNKKNKERDFKYGSFKIFVIVAVIITLLFLLTILAIVQVVLG